MNDQRNIRIWLAAGLLLCVALLACRPVYETDDDAAMVGLLSGQAYGRSFEAVFLSQALSDLLIRLYALRPNVAWYGLFMTGCNLVAAVLWLGLILKRVSRPSRRALALAAFLAVYSYSLLRLNFMGVALGLYLAALAWISKWQVEQGAVRGWQAGAGLLLGVAYLIRPNLAGLMLYYCGPVLLLSFRRVNARRLAWIALPAILMIGWTWSSASWPRTAEVGDDPDFNVARGAFLDKPHVATPEALAAADWSRRDYEVAFLAWMHDEQLFDSNRLWCFLAKARTGLRVADYGRLARDHLFRRHHLFCLLVLAASVIFLWLDKAGKDAVARPAPPRRVGGAVWAWLLAGWVLLLANRLPARAYVPLYLFIGVMSAWVPPPVRRPPCPDWVRRRLRGPVAAGLGLAAVFAAAGLGLAAGRAGREQAILRDAFTSGAAQLGPRAVVVPLSSLYNDCFVSIFRPLPSRPPGHLVPAGWVLRSPAYYHVLSAAGFAGGRDLMRRSISHPDVVFACRREEHRRVRLLQRHLQDRYANGRELEIVPATGGDPAGAFFFFRVVGHPATFSPP